MYYIQIDLLRNAYVAQGYTITLLNLLPPNFEQRGQMCKLTALSAAMQWSYQQAPEQMPVPPYPTKTDIRKNHMPEQVKHFNSLRKQAKQLQSQVGEIYNVEQLILLANNNGYANVYYKNYDTLDTYQKDLMDAIDQEIMVNVFYDVNMNDGSPIQNNSYTEHSGLVIGYAVKTNEPPLAILSTHNQYIAVKIEDLFASTIQLQAARTPESFFKDSNKFWRNVEDHIDFSNLNYKIRKASAPSKEAVSFRGKMIFYPSNIAPQNNKACLNEELIKFSDKEIEYSSLVRYKQELISSQQSDYIPLEILVHFLETLHTLNYQDSVELFERFAREFNFSDEIIRICLEENDTEVSGALMDDIFKQNPETKRSIVELTSNALDAKAKPVRVNIIDGEYRVFDNGIGMSAYELFNHLLVSKISSKNSLVDVIGRFGIGFYTCLAHLKNEHCNVTVKSHSAEDEYGYIIHFRWQNARMEVNIRKDKDLPFGTEMIVQSDEINKIEYENYLKNHFAFVEDERLIINETPIILDKNYQTLATKQGTVLFKREEKDTKGSIKVVIARALITEYFYEANNSNLTVVWMFPNQTSITENRNAIQVDSLSIVALIKEFINAAYDMPQELQVRYLNTISPGIVEMQARNTLKGEANNLKHYLCDVLTKLNNGKKCIPDETDYHFLANEHTENVSRNIIADNWKEQIGVRIEEWESEKINAYAIEMNGKQNIFYDSYHHDLFLSSAFLNHVRNNGYINYLSNLVEILQLKGNFLLNETLSDVIPHQANTYTQYQFEPHHDLYNHHGGLHNLEKQFLDQIPATLKPVLLNTPTLVARYPYQGLMWASRYGDSYGFSEPYSPEILKDRYLNQDYFIRHDGNWKTVVYDQHFQVILGEKGAFLAAYFRNKNLLKKYHNVEMDKLIIKKSDSHCQLIDLKTQKIVMDNLSLCSVYIPIPNSNLYCIKTLATTNHEYDHEYRFTYDGINTIYSNNLAIEKISGDMKIFTWGNYYLVFNSTSPHSKPTHLSLYTKEFVQLSKTEFTWIPIYGEIYCELYQHTNQQLMIIYNQKRRIPLLYNSENQHIAYLSNSFFIGSSAIAINDLFYTLAADKSTLLLGKVLKILGGEKDWDRNSDELTHARGVVYTDSNGNTKIYGANEQTSNFPEEANLNELITGKSYYHDSLSYEFKGAFQSIRLGKQFYKSDGDWIWAQSHKLAESSVDSFVFTDYEKILNSKNQLIFTCEESVNRIESRKDCPYLIIEYNKQKERRRRCSVINSKGDAVVSDTIYDAKFVKNKNDWTIHFYTACENGLSKKIILNKNGMVERAIHLKHKLLPVDCDEFIWYPLKTKEKTKKITSNAYYLPKCSETNTAAYFYKFLDQELLLDKDVIKNITFLNDRNLSITSYSNYLRFIACDHHIFVTLYDYLALFKYTPTREQFRDYYKVYQSILLSDSKYINIAMKLMDILYYSAGPYSELHLTDKLIDIVTLYGLSILRELHEIYVDDAKKIYYYHQNNKPLHEVFARLPEKLRDISYFIFSNKNYLFDESVYEPLLTLKNNHHQISSSILHLIACISLRKKAVKNAQHIKSVMDLANQMSGKLNTSLALRHLKHAIYNLSDSSRPIYLREFLQNALDASGTGMTVQVEFFNQRDLHVTRIRDTGCGMSLNDLFAYLIIPGNSTKRQSSEFIGGRGVGFFSAFNGAKEIHVKTSTGNGITYYFTFTPYYDENNKIYDINITVCEKTELFKGTIIDRISASDHALLDAARCLSAIRQYGCFIDATKVKVIVNQTQINKDLIYLGELKFAKIGACKIYSNSECVFTAGGLYIKKIDDFYWLSIPRFMALALRRYGILIDLPAKIALSRERNNFQNADQFIEYFKPLFFQLCLNAYCTLLKNGKISDDYLPNDLFKHLAQDQHYLSHVETIKQDINAFNQGKLITDYKKYLNHDLCIKLIANINFIHYGSKQISMGTIAELNQNSQLQLNHLPEFIQHRLKRQEECITHQKHFNQTFSKANNTFEKEVQKFQYCSWTLPDGAFKNAPNWALFYKLIHHIVESVAQKYALDIDVHFSTIHPSALAYVNPSNFSPIMKNDSLMKKVIIYINPLSWDRYLNNAFFQEKHKELINKLILTIAHEITHLIEGSGCRGGARVFTHDYYFNEIHAQVYTNILMHLDVNQLTLDAQSEIKTIAPRSYIKLPDAKELMIMQVLGQENYLEFLYPYAQFSACVTKNMK